MRIHTELDVPYPRTQVWDFSVDPMNQLKWDRSVAEVVLTSDGPVRAGYTFDTVGPKRSGDRRAGITTSYRVAEYEPERHARIEVTNSPTFRRAVWDFRFEQVPGGTRVVWNVELTAKARYPLLTLIMRLNRHQLVRDMRWFEEALAEECSTDKPSGGRSH
ncbi:MULTISPECIES: SRPBCC family protein [unclassified Streptosporangium]|uniref:SRPBCC family protein n=1 Tax=unclassified Streptosporangium TaxID=2632669 RepID=UPI002E2A43E6|nr:MULTISPECIES: SRPBCC family protein [unclassified Streptosporangium]